MLNVSARTCAWDEEELGGGRGRVLEIQASSPELHVYGIERLQSGVLSLAMTSLERDPHCLMEKLGKEVRK